MQNSVSHDRLANMPGLRIRNTKGVISIMFVPFTCQVLMKLYDVIHKRKGEGLSIRLALLSVFKFLPYCKEVF